jgi:hypothetical protein
MEQAREGSFTEEVERNFAIARALNEIIYDIEVRSVSIFGANRTPVDIENAKRELEYLYSDIMRGKGKKLPDRAAEVIENAIRVFEEKRNDFERRKNEEQVSFQGPFDVRNLLIQYYDKSIQQINYIIERLRKIRELIPSPEEQQPTTEEAPPKAEPTPKKEPPPATARKAPTLSGLTVAVNAFVNLIIILNELADKAPIRSIDSLSYWNFLRQEYLPRDKEIKALIEKISQVYPDLTFTPQNAVSFLTEVYKRLKEDLAKWREWATQQTLVKADIQFITLLTIPQLEMLLESISEEAINRAGILLQAAEESLKGYESALRGVTKPAQIEQRLKIERLKAGKRLLESLQPLKSLPKFQRKKVEASGFRLSSSEEGRRIIRQLFSELRGTKIPTEGKPTPRIIYFDIFQEMLRILHDFLWMSFPFGEKNKSLEEITEEDFGPLGKVGMEWRNKAITLRKVLSEYIKRYRRRPRKSIGEELEEIENKLLQHLKEFIEVSNNLVRQYVQVKQQYEKMREKGKKELSKLPNFETLLNAEDGIPLLQNLVTKISQWKQALETSQQLLRALLPQDDRERQQRLIEEKHTL